MFRRGIGAARIALVSCLALLALPLESGCDAKNGGALTCTAIGCDSVIVGRFPLDVVGSFHGAFESRMCLDGTCRTARGVLDPHEGSLGQTVNRFVQSGVEVTAFEDEIEVQMNLPTGRYDDVTSHRIVVELTRENQDPLAIDTQTRFERNQPNGAACGPTCWLADLSWIAPRSP